MPRKIHMCMDVRGFMRNNSYPRGYRGVFSDPETGRTLSPAEAQDFLLGCIAKGWKVIPLDSACEGFDYQKGCPGNEVENGTE